MGLDRPMDAPATAKTAGRHGPSRRTATWNVRPPSPGFLDPAGRGQVMATARRLAPLPLLMALLALGVALLWLTPAEAQVTTRILVSNLDQGDGNAETTNGNDHAQLFHTGGATIGYLLTSVIVSSVDPQGDDFDVEVCLANNDTGFPTSTCTELNPPNSYASGDLTFTAPGDGMRLQRNDNYSVVIKQKGTGSVILDSTTSGGEDSTGLSGWSIKDKFDWKDSGTWKPASGDEAIRIEIRGHEAQNQAATGRPVVLVSAEGAGILAADTWRISDADGLPYTDFKGSVDPPGSGGPDNGEFVFDFSYQWIRVDADTGTDTNIGTDSPRYQLVDADFGKRIKVQVSFTDRFNSPEAVTSVPFGPMVRPAPLPSPSTLVGNTGQSPSDVATIRQLYAMGFRLGDHGQGYEISSVEIDLAAAPTDLTVSLWTGGPPGSSYAGTRTAKLFEFENPASFQVGLNEFTAPAGVFAYHSLDQWIVLSGFGSSLSITETSSDAEDAGGEPGAVICNFSGNEYVVNEGEVNEMQVSCNDDPGDSSVLRLAIKGSPRTSGILAANFAQSGGGETTQEIISAGDNVGFGIDVGAADRYLIRGLTLSGDDTTPGDGGFDNPFYFRSDSLSGARHFDLFQTRNVNGLPVWTAPQGATVAGRKTYVFDWQFTDGRKNGSDTVTRIGAILHRVSAVADDADGRSDAPTAPGVSLAKGRDVSGIDNRHNTAYMAVHGEPLYAVVQNLGQADNGYVSVGSTNTVVSQGFTTGSLEDGYPLLGFGVNIEGPSGNFPRSSASVAVALHRAAADGKPDEKLFDLLSPTEYAAGHSFFEAPRATTLDPSTSYVLVWRHVSGASHRLQKTSSNGEDPGAYAGFSMADAFHRGADLGNLAEDSNGNALGIAVYARVENQPATGRPVVYPSADGAGILLADPFGIADPNGVLVYNPLDDAYVRSYDWSYQWIRVDGETGAETEVGADSARYQPAGADTGHLLKVRVSFTDQAGNPEEVTSRPFGPIAAAGPSTSYPSTLVSNTGRSSSATANITQQYALGFRLGSHGQGYEISSVSLELAAAPSDLTVSLWIGVPPGHDDRLVASYRVFDFENPSSLQAGENRFTAPAGAFAYQNMNYFIVLSGFGSSLQVKETTANAEDPGGETGAVLFNDARVRALGETGRWTSSSTRAGVLRLAVEGWRRDRGFLASNYGQVLDNQEIISKGDEGGMPITLGEADRYIIRGFSWVTDDTTPDFGGIHNPFDLRSGWTLHGDGKINSAGKKWFGLIPTRYETPGINLWTAPQGATVPGNAQYMVYEKYLSRPVGPILTRTFTTSSDKDDPPTAPGATLSDAIGDIDGRPVMAFLGEPLEAMAQNLGQTNSGYASVGGANAKVLSQGFTTGSDGFGYRLQGIGVNIEGSDGRVPDDASSVSVSVHADSGGQPGDKLFDLVSPTNYAAGHSFFEAPPGTYLDPSTGYVLVWTYNQGAWHRLRRTSSNGEDAGALTGAGIADAYYLGADPGSLAVDPGGNALEFAVYTQVLDTEPIRPGEFVIQSPTQALVSNIGQTSEGSGYETSDSIRYAPSFNTGPEAVTLDSVELDVETAPATTSDVSVAIHRDASGDPGSKLYDLANPATIGTGVQKFTAPAAARLDADTTYYVVISSSGSTIKMSFTNSDNEDAGGADGWTIDNRMHFRRGSWDTDNSVIQIRVNGHFSRTVTPTEVPFDWPLLPDEVGDEGGQFRLLFLSSGETAATSTDIDTYNSFVQTAAAAGHDAIQDYSEGFRAVASTGAVAARDNTYTTGTSVPIYWLGGNKLANSYRDFYDGSWDDEENPTDESGAAIAINSVWTGSGPDGTKGVHDTHGATVLGGGARAQAAFGRLDSATAGPLSGGHGWREIERSLYAISGVFTVGPNPARITDLAITSDPGPDGIYRTGDEIEATATYGAPVTVSGRPRVQLQLGRTEESQVWAEYQRGGGVVVPDGTERVLVSNSAVGTRGRSEILDNTTTKAAQAFTTGAESDGYRLDSIGAYTHHDNVATAGAHLTATLNADDNGNPGAALCILTDPTTFDDNGRNRFAAPTANPCPTLAANTAYFIVIERVTVDSDDIGWFAVSSTREDIDPAAGWSIGDSRHTYASGVWTDSVGTPIHGSQPFAIEVTGAVALPFPVGPLVRNTGQTSELIVTDDLTDELIKLAQTFTTGAEPSGYALSSIGVKFILIGNTSTAGKHLRVTLNANNNGSPGDPHCTLDDPATFTDGGVQTFDAPPALCPTLAASTTYFVVIERVEDHINDVIQLTLAANNNHNEDAGGAAGWSIGNGRYSLELGESWAITNSSPYQIEVAGAVAPPPLVSNTGQTLTTLHSLDDSESSRAQSFTTGNAAAYALGSIGFDFSVFTNLSSAGDHLTATLNSDASGSPGEVLCTLSDPANFIQGLNAFDAPPDCPTLSPNTTYFAVVDRVIYVAGDGITLASTSSNNEDAGSAAGWSIGNGGHVFNVQQGRWLSTSQAANQVEIHGFVVPAGYNPEQLVFSYTVQAGDESDTDGVAVGVAGEENAIDLNGGAITLGGTSRGALLGFSPVPSDAGHLVNWARPTLADAATSAGGRRLFLTFSEELNPDGSPPTSSFAVTVDGGAASLRGTTASVAGRVVILRLATPLDSAARTLSVSYTDPSADDDTAAVEDRQGNDAASFRGRTVTNRFGAVNRVFPGFALVPASLGVGDSFRLLFVTSTTRDATATDIETYNAFVQAAAAAGHAGIQDYRAGFFAVASTADADARDNTGTTYTSNNTGVPIYWLAGNQVAGDYADFYDGDWDDEENATDESGSASALNGAWTGSGHDGTEAFDGSRSLALGGDATDTAGIGLLNSVDSGVGPLAGSKKTRDTVSPLYGLSEVFTVVDAASITDVAIVSDRGAGGNYVTGDEFEVAVTFGRPVEIEGNPRIRLRLAESGESVRWAEYERDPLVRNTGQPQFSGTALTAARPRLAQRFRTGGGVYVYELDAIGIKFHTIANPATAGEHLTVTLNADDNGNPAATPLCTLSDPAEFGATGLQTFDAPDAPDACPDLAAETDYYVVVERVSFSAAETIAVWHTASAREDAGVASGWSIGDRGHTDTSSWSDGGPPFLIKVMGDLPAEFQDRVLISNVGQTQFSVTSLTILAPRLAQAFDTGAYPNGYRLSTIGIAFGTIDDTASAAEQLRVTLNAENNRIPSYALCTLSPPASFSENAVNRFDAASCPALARNTRYYVVAEHLTPETSDFFDWSSTKSVGEDTGGAVGWNVIEVLHSFLTEGWVASDGGIHQIEVSGRRLSPAEQPAPPEPPASLIKQVANTGQTGLAGSGLTSTQSKHAQAFTTGATAGGYELSNIGIRFGAIAGSRVHADITVSLHAGGADDPGELLCEFSEPLSVLSTNRLVPWDERGLCPHLETNTTYFVVVDRHTFTAGRTIEVSVTPSDGEDSARPGWTIADDSRVYDGSAWASGGGASLAIDVHAVDLPPEEPAEQPSNLGPVQDLVSNTGQTDALRPDLLVANGPKYAQAFTTGANEHGYNLGSIGVYFSEVDREATAGAELVATLNADDNGSPGPVLCTLSDPATFTDSGVNTFGAPATCPTLAASTNYHVVIERLAFNGGVIALGGILTDAEDDGGAPGWSIVFASHVYVTADAAWSLNSGLSYLLKIRAAAVLSDPSGPEAAPQPRRFIYTVAANDESTVRGVAVGGSGATDDLDLNGGAITVAATGAEAPLEFQPLPQDGDHLVNWARPALVRAGTSRDGSLVRLTFSEELETGGQVPSARFTVEVDDVAVELTGIDVEESISVGADPPSAVDTWSVDAPREAPADWVLTPAGLSVGDEFRLLFLTSTTRDATSTDIDDYNTFVRTAAAAGHTDIRDHSQGFYAVASTADDDARDNTETTYTASDKGVPIYWLGGNQLADDYEDFYDGSWDDEVNTTDESGNPRPVPTLADYPWTGSKHDGTEVMEHGNSLTLGSAGSHSVVGSPNAGDATDGPLNSLAVPYAGLRPLYALSLPFVVTAAVERAPPVEPQVLGSVVTLELVAPLSSPDQEVTVSYADPSRNDDTGVVEDLVGNDADSFTDRPVTNRVAFAPPSVEVPADWALAPGGLPAGAEFRLLFLTSGGRDATSTVINDYDDFVQSVAAGGHGAIREYAGGFFAVASTPDTDARDNTATTYTASNRGVPIYWLGGAQIADNYSDFYDGSWDDEVNATDQSGARRRVSASADYPWTGSDHDGTEKTERGRSLALGGSGAVAVGAPNVAEPGIGPLDGGDAPPAGLRPLYALSQVFVVEPLPVPAGSPIVPEGLTDGDRFRLLFLSSGVREATSSAIADYNDFIQAAAADGHSGVQAFSDGFQAVASTAQVDARENTWTRTAGVPIYWLGGGRLADDYADFYDGSWAAEAGATDESGAARGVTEDGDRAWTGSDHDGTQAFNGSIPVGLGGGSTGRAVVGQLGSPVPGHGPLRGSLIAPSAEQPLYGLSPVLVVIGLPDTPPDVPGLPPARQSDAPTGLVAEPGYGSVTLSWDPSGAIITHYEYEQDGVWKTTESKDTTFTVEDLDNRQTYRFRVRAVYGAGTSDPAALQLATPAAQPPDPPTLLEAVSGNGSVKLTWTAPDWDGGQAITHYEYEQDGVWETTGSRDTTFTVTGLTNGQSYMFRVQAANGVGASRPSNSVTAEAGSGDVSTPPPAQQQGGGTRSNAPDTGAPTISGTPRVGETLTADTSTIDDADGLTKVSYRYQWVAGGSDIDGATNSTYTLTSGEQGQAVRVRVTFNEDSGNGESLTSAATEAVAAAPAPLTAALPDSRFQSARHKGADDRPQVVVAFSLPVASFEKTTPSLSLTGAAVSSVRQHEEDGLDNAWIFFLDPDGSDDIVFSLATGQPCDSGGICTEDGTTLSEGVQVTLPGPEEKEQEEAGDDQQTPESPPAKPTNLTATVNADGYIVLSWTAPDDDSVTGYQVLRRRPSEGESALLVYVADTESTATTFTDTGVTAGVKHVYRVKAINAAGLSGWSNYVNPTP